MQSISILSVNNEGLALNVNSIDIDDDYATADCSNTVADMETETDD
jgi:hypothetical protein